jgi:hypothetical protein
MPRPSPSSTTCRVMKKWSNTRRGRATRCDCPAASNQSIQSPGRVSPASGTCPSTSAGTRIGCWANSAGLMIRVSTSSSTGVAGGNAKRPHWPHRAGSRHQTRREAPHAPSRPSSTPPLHAAAPGGRRQAGDQPAHGEADGRAHPQDPPRAGPAAGFGRRDQSIKGDFSPRRRRRGRSGWRPCTARFGRKSVDRASPPTRRSAGSPPHLSGQAPPPPRHSCQSEPQLRTRAKHSGAGVGASEP